MRRKESFVVWYATAACCVFMAEHVSSREVVDNNFGWKFHRAEGDPAVFSATSFDDNEWRVLDLPHDFQIEQPWAEPTDEQKRMKKNSSRLLPVVLRNLETGSVQQWLVLGVDQLE